MIEPVANSFFFEEQRLQINYYVKPLTRQMLDLFNSYSPDDQKKVLKALSYRLLFGKQPEPFKTSSVFKIDSTGTDEEIIQRIEKETGHTILRTEEAKLSNLRPALETHFNRLQNLIAPYKAMLNANGTEDEKLDELNDLGRFILSFDEKISIVDRGYVLAHPDFIIRYCRQPRSSAVGN